MRSLGNMDLRAIMGLNGGGSAGDTPTGSTSNPDACALCGALGTEQSCNGSGFFDVDVPVGHPYFSKVFRCPNNPIDQDTSRLDKLRDLSNLGAFGDKTFDNFKLDPESLPHTEHKSLEQAHRMAIHFASNPDRNWLVINGTYGCGKTHLAAAVGNARLEQGDMVLFITAPDLLDYLRKSFTPGAESYEQTFDRVRRAGLLILDDLGVENPSDWAKEKLFQLLNYRYNERLPTVITTNRDIDMLDPRLRSRMLDIEVVRYISISAPDYRSARKNAHEQLSDLNMYIGYNFDDFDFRAGCLPNESQNLGRALAAAQDYAESGTGWFALIGESGTGKTHLAAAIANTASNQGRDVMFVTVSNLLDYLRRTFSPASSLSFEDQFQQVKEVEFLVLDDLTTTESSKPWAREKLIQIIKHRYIKHLPTVVTTAVSFDDLENQIRTRLMDRRLCKLVGINARAYVERTQGGL